jgi:hypothetical protein
MSDRWEGSFGEENTRLRPQLYGEHYEGMFGGAELRRSFMLTHFHLSCWHLSEYESAAMWEIYQREGRGVAVRSTWSSLTTSILSDRDIRGGLVSYVDYRRTFIPERNAFDAFMHKRLSFSHEREVRLAMMTGFATPEGQPGPSTEGPEALAIPVAVDLPKLVQAVYVAPDAPDWTLDVVENVTRRYGFRFPVHKSDLASDPIA